MIRLLIDLSRYVFVLNLLIYLIIGYIALLQKEEKRSGFLLFVQAFLVFANHITAAFVLMASRQSMIYLLFPLIQIIVIISYIVLMQVVYPEASRLLTNNLAFFISIGLIEITRLYFDKSIKQFIIICFAFVISFFVPFIFKKRDVLKKISIVIAIIGVFLLASVLIKKEVVNGSMLTLTIFGYSFQPSEFVKLTFIVGIAGLLSQCKKLLQYVLVTVLALCHILVLAYTRDLGTAVIFYITYTVMLFVATKKKRCLVIGGAIAVVSSIASYFLFSHVRTRVSVWLSPFMDIDGKGYQTTQSLFAICSGNFWGFGLDGGVPHTIPYVDQDFIFSAICEEYGTVFGVLFILLCLNFFLEIIHISKANDDLYLKTIGIGAGILFFTQVILTIGGNINFIPMTGVTLFLTSYGGSSAISSVLLFSIVQSISVYRNDLILEEKTKCIELNIIQVLYSLVAISMGASLLITVYNQRNTIINNSYNTKRQNIIAQSISRGDILSSDGKVLATNISSSNNKNETRIYPYGYIFSHVVGFSSLGGLGVEKDYDVTLMTSSISMNQWVEDDLKDEKHKGNSVILTINSELQNAAYNALGIYEGAIIVMNPTTGEILAMVSKPDFDPNTIEEDWDKLINSDSDSRLVNRATCGLYPPGSTFKILTALEFIRENNDIDKYSYYCKGSNTVEGNTIRCYHGTNHGQIDFETSFAKSCNSSFSNIGLQLDFSKFQNSLKKFYFGKALNLDFETKISLISSKDSVHDIMQTCIGQGETLITPLELCMITSSIANNGTLLKPYLVSSITSNDGNVLKNYKSEQMSKPLTQEEAQILKELMISVVEKGTATKLKNQNVKVAGKTGSAEFKTTTNDSHAWFTCFTYDTENPVVVTVIMEGAGSGGEYAVPVARQILDVYYNTIIDD